MLSTRSAVGIDIGSRRIRVAELAVGDEGIVVTRALSVGWARLESDGIAPGDLPALARGVKSRMVEAGISTRGVVLGIGHQESMLRYARIAPVPSWRLDLIMKYEVGEVAERVGEPVASDHRVLPLPREPGEDQTVLLALAKEAGLSRMLEALEAQGITVERVLPHPLALFAAYDALGRKTGADAEDDDVTLVADLGAECLDIAILLNGRLAFARTAGFGGQSFTDRLAQDLGIKPRTAERLKIERGGLGAAGDDAVSDDTVAPLRGVAAQLVGTIQSSLRLAGTQTGQSLPALRRCVVCGGGMRLRGLPAFLSRSLDAPVEVFRPAGLKVEAEGEAALRLRKSPGDSAVVLGLAISKLGAGARAAGAESISLLPGKYLKRRELRERTVFLYGAAALLVILLLARFAVGFVRNSEAEHVYRVNQQALSELTARSTEFEQNRRLEDAARARLNRLLREAEQTAFQAFVVDYCARRLRPEIQLRRVTLDYEGEEGSEDYVLRLEGRANNAKRKALAWIRELQADLAAAEPIREAAVLSSAPERGGAWYDFEIALEANYVRY